VTTPPNFTAEEHHALNYTLRPYQQDIIADTREAIRHGAKRIIMSMPTGAGKTVLASSIIESATANGNRSIFLAHRQELIAQCSKKLCDIGLTDHGIIMRDHWRGTTYKNAPVQVASVQSLARRLRKTNMAFDIEIVDECHHATANSYKNIHNAIPESTPRIGITATPWAANGKPLASAFDMIIEGPETQWLIDNGYLCQFDLWSTPVDLSKIKTKASDFDMESAAKELSTVELNGNIADHWLKHAAGRPTLFFCCNVQHSYDLCEQWQKQTGYKGVVVTGNTPKDTRDAIPTALESGEIHGVFNCEVYTEGTDIPCISCVVLARPTKSWTLSRQIPGRGLRVHDSKENCIILDHAGWYDHFGLITDKVDYSLERGIIKKKSGGAFPERCCPACRQAIKGWPTLCPYCHTELPRTKRDEIQRQIEENASIELQQITEKTSRNARHDYFHRMVDQAYLRNSSPQWALNMFNKKYHYWPNAEMRKSAPYKMVFDDGKLVWESQRPKPQPANYDDVFRKWRA